MPGESHQGAVGSDRGLFNKDIVKAFLPYLSIAERERFVARMGEGNREGPDCQAVSSTSAASNEPGGETYHPGPETSIGADDGDGFERLGNEIISRLIASPLPLSFLITIAGRCDFPGLPMIEHAASVSASTGRAAPLFDDAGRAMTDDNSKPAGDGPGGSDQGVDAAGLTVESAFRRLFSALGEERAGQIEMAGAVDDAFRNGGTVMIEAGTGTGKSLAYLVPSVLYSNETGERIVISTHTRNLQDQLFDRELPRLKGILKIGVDAERLTGRENYLCSKRLVSIVARDMDEAPQRALALGLGAALSRKGTVDSLPVLPDGVYPPYLRAPARCLMNACGQGERCPLVRIRKRARDAKILFVNHALLMTDYRQGNAVLGPYRRVVFDEAHHLERCVMENLSVMASRDDIERILEPAGPVSQNNDRWKFLLMDIEGSDPSIDYTELFKKISSATRNLREKYSGLFESAGSSLNKDRIYKNTKSRYRDGKEAFAGSRNTISDYLLTSNELNDLLKLILETNVSSGAQDFQQELKFIAEELGTLSDSLKFLTTAWDEDFVFWLEWGGRGALNKICASPLNVDRLFADYIEDACESAVFTSATLAQGESFNFTSCSLGLHLLGNPPSEVMVPSPFDYNENCLILLHTGLGDPNSVEYAGCVAEVVGRLARDIGRRMIVLCTSYRLCHATARILESLSLPGPVLVQGEGESREALSERLRTSKTGVLLGVASFWEGVDFPGEELELLVIPKVPFPVPTEPIVEARSERLRARGEDPFEGIFLPKAILRLRQGIGRLIRRKKDRGVVVILDERLETRPYGETILSSLPARAVRAETIDEITDESLRWFPAPTDCSGK